jgi:DNA helicase-2/ATP-dependent DNA helicase PcrA
MKRDGRIIRGRIDAVYETDDGGLEIVDFKTGHVPKSGEGFDQLDLYGDALEAVGVHRQMIATRYLMLTGERTPLGDS